MTTNFLTKHDFLLVPENIREALAKEGIYPVPEFYDADNVVPQGSIKVSLDNETGNIKIKYKVQQVNPKSCHWLFDGEKLQLVYIIYN